MIVVGNNYVEQSELDQLGAHTPCVLWLLVLSLFGLRCSCRLRILVLHAQVAEQAWSAAT